MNNKVKAEELDIISKLLKSKVPEGHLFWWLEAPLTFFKGKTTMEMLAEGKFDLVFVTFNKLF